MWIAYISKIYNFILNVRSYRKYPLRIEFTFCTGWSVVFRRFAKIQKNHCMIQGVVWFFGWTMLILCKLIFYSKTHGRVGQIWITFSILSGAVWTPCRKDNTFSEILQKSTLFWVSSGRLFVNARWKRINCSR